MKATILTVILCCLLWLQGVACGTHSLHTQSDVDHLICSAITSDVTIEESTSTLDHILNLDTLVTIVSIGGNLIIRNNPMLSDISGLANLARVGGDLIIENNPLLNECCALDLLINHGIVDGNIIIANNGPGNCDQNGNNISECLPIPDLTEWGIVILSLLLFIIGTLSITWNQQDRSISG